jgi:hypothetical protein
MSKTTGTGLFAAIAATLILAGVAGWPVSDTQARAPWGRFQIDPFTMMTSEKQLPTGTSRIIPSCSIERILSNCEPRKVRDSWDRGRGQRILCWPGPPSSPTPAT